MTVNGGTVGKALEVLDQVAAFGRPVRFAELQTESRFPKATLYRLVQSLTEQGMLNFDPDRHTYGPGLRLVRLAHAAWQQSSLAQIARPHVDRLAESVCEAVDVAQIDHGHVVFVDRRQQVSAMDVLPQTGLVAPSFCTGVGKVILAFLPEDRQGEVLDQQAFVPYTEKTHLSAESLKAELDEIRQSGIALEVEEHFDGIVSVAAPILKAECEPVGAISIATYSSRRTIEDLRGLSPNLRETAARIATEIEPWHFPN